MKSTAEEKKHMLVDELASARRSILDTAADISTDCWEDTFLGEWSLKDLLSHLIGWDYTNIQAIQEILSGQYPSFFQYYDKDWASYNRRLVQQYKTGTCTELLAAVETSHRLLLDSLESIPARDLLNTKARSERGRSVGIRTLLAAEAKDERGHARQIAEFWGLPGCGAEEATNSI